MTSGVRDPAAAFPLPRQRDDSVGRRDADALGRQVASAVAERLPDAGSLTWAARAVP